MDTDMAKRKKPDKFGPLLVQAENITSLAEVTGTEDPKLAQRLLNQVVDTLWMPAGLSDEERIERVRAAVSALKGIKPQDEIEGMLAAQMIATHSAAMEYLRRAIIPNQTTVGIDLYLKHATKLLSVFAKQLETLNRNRGKGQQKVTVEHVQVQSGGQAIVGNIEHKPK